MKSKPRWIYVLALALGCYVLAAAVIAFILPSAPMTAQLNSVQQPGPVAAIDHVHASDTEAEPLTGPFGIQGERHPPAAEFANLEAGLTERRRQSMRAMSGHFRAISATLLSQAGGEGMLQTHADALALIGAEIDQLFNLRSPTAEGQLGALPAIWDDPERFALFSYTFRNESAQFAETVRDAGDVMNGLHDLRYYCVACHANFRQR